MLTSRSKASFVSNFKEQANDVQGLWSSHVYNSRTLIKSLELMPGGHQSWTGLLIHELDGIGPIDNRPSTN